MRILVWRYNKLTTKPQRYQTMLNEFLWPTLDNTDLTDIWFQQDGASYNTTRQTIDLLRTKFNGHVISRNGDVNWPERSCDLTPVDYFLWGYLKDQISHCKPKTINQLKSSVADIGPEMIKSVLQDLIERANNCKRGLGSHYRDMVFMHVF